MLIGLFILLFYDVNLIFCYKHYKKSQLKGSLNKTCKIHLKFIIKKPNIYLSYRYYKAIYIITLFLDKINIDYEL